MRLTGRGAALAAIVVIGALARFYGLGFGLPARYHPDELGGSRAVLACVHGHRVARRYHYPPLLVNVACGVDRALRRVPLRGARVQPHEIFSMRLVSATAGTATVAFVYLLALRVVSPAGALGAAFLFACFPAAIATSKYGPPDSLLTMLMAAALWLQLRMTERGDGWAYFQAALVTTLAVSAKYNGAFLAFSFLAAHLSTLRSRDRPLLQRGPVLASVAGIAAGLAAGFPSVLFGGEGAKFVGGVLGEREHLLASGHFGFALDSGEGHFLFHFQHSILPAAGPLLLLLIVVGLIALALSRDEGAWILLAFALPYYATVETIYKVPPSYERYVLPLLCVYVIGVARLLQKMAAIGSGDARPLSPRRNILLALLFVVAAWFPLQRSAAFLAPINDDTRTGMSRWMLEQSPALRLDGHLYAQWPMLLSYYPQPDNRQWLKPLPPRGKGLPATVYVMASSLLYERYFEFPDQTPLWTEFYQRLFAEGTLVREESAGAGRYMFHNPTLRLYRIRSSALREVLGRSAAENPDPPQDGARTSVGQRSPAS